MTGIDQQPDEASRERRALYFDHNACTPVDPRVLERFLAVERMCFANPGSLHRAGRSAAAVMEQARARIADLFEVRPEGVYFVAGGTEANNIVVKTFGDPSAPVLLGPVEHPSVLEAAAARGCSMWEVDADGRVRVAEPDRRIGPVGLVCLVHGQNEIGSLQPVGEAAALARALELPLHVDASQSLGRVPLDEVFAAADTIAFSVHKACGLRGMSVLVRRSAAEPRALFHGGGQEAGLRPGTPSPSLAAATALAIELAVGEQSARAAAMRRACAAFVSGLSRIEHRVLTPQEASLPNTAMCLFPGVDGRNLLPALDMAGVQASQGSACSSGSPTPPKILSAMGLSESDARRCVRFSFSHETREAEAADGARRVVDVVSLLRDLARSGSAPRSRAR